MRDEQASQPVIFLAVLGTLALTTLATALGDKEQPMFNDTVLLAGLAAGYAVAHYVTAEQWTQELTWACINAKMHALSFWRWVGWYCPQQLQPWYCIDVWTNQTSMVYAESTNAWWTAVAWAVLTAFYAVASEDYKDKLFFRAFDGMFWFMFFVAPHLPRLYVEGLAGFGLGSIGGRHYFWRDAHAVVVFEAIGLGCAVDHCFCSQTRKRRAHTSHRVAMVVGAVDDGYSARRRHCRGAYGNQRAGIYWRGHCVKEHCQFLSRIIMVLITLPF